VATANLILLPLSTKLRGRARQEAIDREIIIEGLAAVQEGLNPRVIDQKLRGFMLSARRDDHLRKVA
jgi:chemotaxis protein MotA